MQKVKYIFTIWLLTLLPLAISAQTLLPANNTSTVCTDMQFKLTFNTTPILQSAGKVRLYESNGNLISTIDLTTMPSGTPMSANWPWKETLNGTSINVFRAVIDGKTAIFSFPINSMQYGKSYYVTVDKAVFSNATAIDFNGLTANQWAFQTRTQPTPDRNYTVAADGSGDFATLQGALDFIPNSNTNATRIFIKNGTYIALAFSKNKSTITIEGESTDGVVIKAFNNSTLNASTHWRSVVNLQGNNLYLNKITIVNSTPNGGSQAEAIKLNGEQVIITNCKFYSYQDTQLLEGKVYLKDCFIEGDVDFIWGTGTVFFQSCELRANDNGGYNVMARNNNTRHGYAFADCKLTRKASTTTQYLARDAGATYPYAEVVYLNCSMDKHIPAIGWQIGSTIDGSKAIFAEYHSVDMSGNLINTSSRHAKSRQLSSSQAKQYRDLNWFFNGWTPNAPETISTISIESPTHNSVFNAPSIISFSATTSSTTGNISKVEFFNGSTLLGLANGNNYTFDWHNAPIGIYSIIAKATYQNGTSITSAPITIKIYDCAGIENGTATLDNCGACIGGNINNKSCSGFMEAENACSVDGILLEDKNIGFSSLGYVNADNEIGAGATWNINSSSDQIATLAFRYANAGTTSRDGDLYINGSNIISIKLPSTGDWTTWEMASINIALKNGTNEITLKATTTDGLANIDLISFSEGVTEGLCIITGNVTETNAELAIHPNPTQNRVFWNIEKEWILLNIQGKELAKGKSTSIDLSEFPNGIYFIKIEQNISKIFKK